jgi:hypothetical protein
VLPTVLVLLVPVCSAATHYIQGGGKGSKGGADWSNACSDLNRDGCTPLVRGDTYYIATGTYGAETLNTSPSGTTLILIQGATIANHGTSTGWADTNSVCTGEGGTQAQFPSGWTVSTSYWTVDGSCGGGSANNGSTTGYGFRTQSDSGGNYGLGFTYSNSIVGMTVSHYEIDGVNCCSIDATANGTDGMLCTGGCSVSGQFDHLYIHDVKRTFFLMGGNLTLEYNYLARNRSTSAQHAEAWSYRGGTPIIRYNIIEDYRGTGGFVALGGTTTNAEVYGNVFRVVQGACSGCNPGAQPVIDDTAGVINGLKFYNNTIYGVVGSAGIGDISGSTGYDVRNNLWYGNSYGVSISGQQSYNFIWNTYMFGGPSKNGTDSATMDSYICGSGSNCLGNVGTSNAPPSIAATFAKAPTDLHLTANTITGGVYCSPCTMSGTPLPSPYNMDMDGHIRGVTGGFSVGAYEPATGGGTGFLSPPPTLTAVSQ